MSEEDSSQDLWAPLTAQNPPPLTPTESQRTCASPEEELLVDSGFNKGEDEVVFYERRDESVRLDAVDEGER